MLLLNLVFQPRGTFHLLAWEYPLWYTLFSTFHSNKNPMESCYLLLGSHCFGVITAFAADSEAAIATVQAHCWPASVGPLSAFRWMLKWTFLKSPESAEQRWGVRYAAHAQKRTTEEIAVSLWPHSSIGSKPCQRQLLGSGLLEPLGKHMPWVHGKESAHLCLWTSFLPNHRIHPSPFSQHPIQTFHAHSSMSLLRMLPKASSSAACTSKLIVSPHFCLSPLFMPCALKFYFFLWKI